jgi:hypothetical protein
VNYVWTLLIALLGSLIAVKLKIPAGALVGSLVAVGTVNSLGWLSVPQWPQGTRFCLQLGLGILLGSTITTDTFTTLRELWRPACMAAFITICSGVIAGCSISRILGMERLTALLGSAPGGMTDMSLIALDMGAQGPAVVVMHLTRLVAVIAIVPC